MEEQWTTHIKSKTGLFEIDWKEIWHYKDLIVLFIKRDIATRYKQTVLGPIWLILTPLVTVLMHSFIFGSIAGLSTDGCPQLLFYMSSNAIWSYFALCLNKTSGTFTGNTALFGKVYFPRITVPVATVLTGIIDLLIQIVMLIGLFIFYIYMGAEPHLSKWIILTPILVFQVALLGLGCGIVISSVTTKYRDLVVLVGFGMQLWMYISPTAYGISAIPEKIRNIYLMNPMAPVIIMWRYCILGVGEPVFLFWGVSWIFTLIVFGAGILLFNKTEKTFMDTV